MNPITTPPSRLPQIGTTIFTVMSALAQETGAVNLGQGFPDFNADAGLLDAVAQAMHDGHNQYPPMAGVPALRQAIAGKIATLYGRSYDPDSEITVTAGATQAIITAILALVQPGDEVLVIEPAYDSYVPAILLAGARPVFVAMRPPVDAADNFLVDWEAVCRAITPRTRMLVINTPHNPTGSVLGAEDLLTLQTLLDGTPILVLADEVYEHMVYDGELHQSVARYPDLAERSILVSSFGKTYHVTGWKVGYVAAPAALMTEFRKVHQFNVFTVNTPMQHGLATWLRDPHPYLELPAFYQAKRDLFRKGLEQTRFTALTTSGTYFQLARYDEISTLPESEFCEWLARNAGVAAIPVSAFYHAPHEAGVVRFCFAKRESTLNAALERLARL